MSDLPEDWLSQPLGDISVSRRGITYSSHQISDQDTGVAYINMKSFKKGGGYNFKGLKFFSGCYLKDDLVNKNDLLIANTDVTLDGDIVGVPAYLPKELQGLNVLFSHHVTRIRLGDGISSLYLNYLFNIYQYRRWMLKYARGTTVLMLDMHALKRIPIIYPPQKEEQQKIATILSSIDTAIEKTEALINKYQQIKAGLMQNLFTRGVTADGKLRPPCEQAPELYRETPIGWIPKEWGVEELQKLLAPVGNNLRSGPFGSALLKSELVEDGIPFLGIDNIHVEKFADQFKRFVSEKKFIELNKYSVRPYDVVITIMGTVGRCCVIPSDIDKALSSKHLWTMTFDTNKVVPDLICWQLNYSVWVKACFRKQTQGGIMDAIQSNTLKRLVLPVPPLPEQKTIHNRYISLNKRIGNEQKSLAKLRLQK